MIHIVNNCVFSLNTINNATYHWKSDYYNIQCMYSMKLKNVYSYSTHTRMLNRMNDLKR